MAAKRVKKPSVPPEMRREWLRRREEFGDSYAKIAKDYGYNQRTVKVHVEKASEEKDQSQARVAFVKESLEKHHQDLCHRAEELLAEVTGEKVTATDYTEDLYLNGLRQHLHRSPLWDRIKEWNETLEKLEQLYTKAKTRLNKVLRRTELSRIQSDPPQSVIDGAVEALAHQFKQLSRGRVGLNINTDWFIEERKEGKISVRYGFSHLWWIYEADEDALKKVIQRYEKKIHQWPEYSQAEATATKITALRQAIRIELRGIIIRRVLPGKCAYCPL